MQRVNKNIEKTYDQTRAAPTPSDQEREEREGGSPPEEVVPFENIQVSTQTFTVKTNIDELNLDNFFKVVPLYKNANAEIINMKYKMDKKGVFEEVPQKKRVQRKAREKEKSTLRDGAKGGNPSRQRNFLNCISVVIMTEKKINIKIFKNGVFQITGCKHKNDVFHSMELIFEQLREHKDIFTFKNDDADFSMFIKSAMRNIDFNVNYKIDRARISAYLHNNTEYTLPPLSSTNMGVKLKIPFDIHDLPITRVVYRATAEGGEPPYETETPNNPTAHVPQERPLRARVRFETELLLKDCIDELEPNKSRQKIKFENKFNNATIFQNGKVLMSCVDETFQRKYYYWLSNILLTHKEEFKFPERVKKTFRF